MWHQLTRSEYGIGLLFYQPFPGNWTFIDRRIYGKFEIVIAHFKYRKRSIALPTSTISTWFYSTDDDKGLLLCTSIRRIKSGLNKIYFLTFWYVVSEKSDWQL